MDFSNIIKPGSEVKLKQRFGNLHGIIRGVWISADGFQYEVTTINNGTISHQYIPKEMFDVIEQAPLPVGFQLPSPKSPR